MIVLAAATSDSQAVFHALTSAGIRALVPVTAGGGLNVQRDDFVATDGQTDFVLSLTPAQPATALVFVNGVLQLFSVDYTFPSDPPGHLNWLNTDFTLQAGDIVTAYYGV